MKNSTYVNVSKICVWGRSGLTWRLLTGKGRTKEGRDAGRPLTVLLVLVSVVHLSKRHVLLASLVQQVKTKKEDEKRERFFFCPLSLAEKERKGKGI